MAAAALTGLAVGNHSLTLLLAPPIALYVLAVEPRILLRWRFVLACAVAVVVPTVLVYLELPLRAGPIAGLRAPLVYGRPDTWDGFWYVVLGEQFRGGINDPFGDLPRKLGRPRRPRRAASSACSRSSSSSAFVATAIRRPPYALLTGSALVITCFFNAAYVNADIERYYLGPALIAWTWLAILAGPGSTSSRAAWARATTPRPAASRPRRPGDRRSSGALVAAVLLLAPTAAAFTTARDGGRRDRRPRRRRAGSTPS